MSTPPPDPPRFPPPAPEPYVPFKDRAAAGPSAGADHPPAHPPDPAVEAQRRRSGMSEEERYRAIYGSDAPTRVRFASWGRRVLGYLVDTLAGTVAGIPLAVGYVLVSSELVYTTDANGVRTISSETDLSDTTIALLVVGVVISLGFWFWNIVLRQGRTGCTVGKSVVGIRLVGATSGLPIGAGLSFVRVFAHVVDSLVCYLGWLWPLWDSRRQTLGDKIVGSVVVVQRP